MDNLSGIYDKAFFEMWGRNNTEYVSSAKIITQAIMAQFHPRSLADLGCGCGVYSSLFEEKGVRTLSLDGVQPPEKESFPITIEMRDLTIPFDNIWGPFDVALCLEVAEHIPENLSDVFLDNIIKFSDTLLLSAAPPFQGGHHHVNEQPKRYWVEKLTKRGFAYNRRATGQLVERFKNDRPPHMWMAQHVSVYEKIKDGFPVRQDLPFSNRL